MLFRSLLELEGPVDVHQVGVGGAVLQGLEGVAHAARDVYGIDSTYANLLEDAFQRSGILHLMAVSGGHLAVIRSMIHRI